MHRFLALGAIFALTSGPAFAYIDPATGSMVLQGLIAFFVGAAFTIKTFYYSHIRPFLDRLLNRAGPKDDGDSKGPPA